MIETPFQYAKDFLHFFLTSVFFRTEHESLANGYGLNGHIFRGHSDSNWRLEPAAFRAGNNLGRFTPQAPAVVPNHVPLTLGMQLKAESRAVFLFLEEADRLGLPTPIDYTLIHDDSMLINALFNGQFPEELAEPFPKENFLSATAMAQHYGVPTRLLDWTESPLVAAYFAAYEASSLKKEHRVNSSQIAVIMLNAQHIEDALVPPIRQIHAPRHESNLPIPRDSAAQPTVILPLIPRAFCRVSRSEATQGF